jgi:hypothetical protein
VSAAVEVTLKSWEERFGRVYRIGHQSEVAGDATEGVEGAAAGEAVRHVLRE